MAVCETEWVTGLVAIFQFAGERQMLRELRGILQLALYLPIRMKFVRLYQMFSPLLAYIPPSGFSVFMDVTQPLEGGVVS